MERFVKSNNDMTTRSLFHSFSTLALLSVFALSINAHAQDFHPEDKPEAVDSKKRQAALMIQLFLDSKGCGPGRLDGYWGEFTKKSAKRWNETNPQQVIPLSDKGSPDLKNLAPTLWGKPLVVAYKVTDSDVNSGGSLPAGPAEKAKKESLPYESDLKPSAKNSTPIRNSSRSSVPRSIRKT
ncbi:MAG: hypothetical protein ACKVJU_25150 [Verrucomicrobiales bacterium]